MLSLYSSSCEYVIRVLAAAFQNPEQETFSVETLCRKTGVPEPFTRKAFQDLAKQGVLLAVRGPGGGYRFNRDLCRFSLYDLILAVDEEDAFNRCLMGLSECGEKNPCPLHKMWVEMKTDLIQGLKSKRLCDITNRSTKRRSVKKKLKPS